MKINFLLIFFWFIFLLVSSFLFAFEKSVYGLVGGGLGYSHLLSSKDNEQNKTGYRLNLSGFLSYRHDTTIWDFGGGWMLNRLKNDGEKK